MKGENVHLLYWWMFQVLFTVKRKKEKFLIFIFSFYINPFRGFFYWMAMRCFIILKILLEILLCCSCFFFCFEFLFLKYLGLRYIYIHTHSLEVICTSVLFCIFTKFLKVNIDCISPSLKKSFCTLLSDAVNRISLFFSYN